VRLHTIRAGRKPRPFILIKALADIAPIVQRRIHLCNFVDGWPRALYADHIALEDIAFLLGCTRKYFS
jgi:hypothetical protein